MRILVIDNNIMPESWGASEIGALARAGAGMGATIYTRRAPHGDLPRDPSPFDRILISGSKTGATDQEPWIDTLDQFIRRAVDLGKPLLGVCYGHQSLARALGGLSTVRTASRGEYGWGEVEVTASSPLFKGLPRKFHTFQWHRDEVLALPPGARSLARSETCPIQAIEIEGRPAWGIQFHPERGCDAGEQALTDRLKQVKINPSEILNRGRGKKLFDASVGETIFRNFLTQGS